MATGLDPNYTPLTGIQEQLIDKLTGLSLSAGVVYFFSDTQRSLPKEVYALAGSPPDYTYESIGSSITLSSIGTFDNSLGSNLVPYLKSTNAQGDLELYYITVYNSSGQFQFSVGGLPNISVASEITNPSLNNNYIQNGQFLSGQLAAPGTITSLTTDVAYGPWQYLHSSNAATDTVTFDTFTAPLNGVPSGNPRYACRVACSAINAGDTQKVLQIVFQDVNRFSSTTQQFTLFFSGKNNNAGLLQLNANLYKNFGTGGSTPTNTPIGSFAFTNSGYTDTVLPFFFGNNYNKLLGSNNDDYFAIQIEFPPTSTFDISLTDFALFLGNIDVKSYPFTLNPIQPYAVDASIVTDPTTSSLATVNTALSDIYAKSIIGVAVQTFDTSGTYTPNAKMVYCTIECWGGGAGAGGCSSSSNTYGFGSGGGGAGGYSRKTVSKSTIGASQTVAIGNLGVGGIGNNAGIVGGATSVGAICIANGGYSSLGATQNSSVGGDGGAPGTGDIAAPGMAGSTGPISTADVVTAALSGAGGSTLLGSGGIGNGALTASANGKNATGYGAGGGGAVISNVTTTTTGGNGTPGYVIITEFLAG